MKAKLTIFMIISILSALIASECLVRFVIHYPTYGLLSKVHYRIGGEYWTNIWKPYSKYWNVEGGNIVYSRNNLGFPGKDTDTTADNRIAVLGTSYLEAYQINPQKIACSVFSDLLAQNGMNYGVYNLGASGHDPYDSYMRLKYFEPKIKPQTVILVINSDNYKWFQRHPKPLKFEPDNTFGTIKQGRLTDLLTYLRNRFSLVSLLTNAIKPQSDAVDTENKTIKKESKSNQSETKVISEDLMQTLEQLHTQYDKFILVSIVNDQIFNDALFQYSISKSIAFNYEPLLTRENMLHGAGHLNETGNQKLGKLLYKSFTKSINPINLDSLSEKSNP